MTREQVVVLCRAVKAYCPAQAMDRYTPDAWYEILGQYSFTEASEAVRAVARVLRFIAPADIIAEIRRVQNEQFRQYQEGLLWEDIRRKSAEARAGQRGAPPASLRETIAGLRQQLTGSRHQAGAQEGGRDGSAG